MINRFYRHVNEISANNVFVLFLISRPLACFFSGVFCIFACFIVGIDLSLFQCSIIFIMICCQVAASFAINDYFDVEQDKYNHPERPLPSNKIKRRTVKNYAIALFITSCVMALFIDYYAFALIAFNNVMFYAYSKIKKLTAVIGNLVICYAIVSLFIFPITLGANIQNIVPAILIAFAFIYIREIVLDTWDVRGDHSIGIKTLPMIIGVENVFLVAWFIILVLVVGVLGSGVFGLFGKPVFVIVPVLAGIFMLGLSLRRYQSCRQFEDYIRFRLLGFFGLIITLPGLFGV